MAYLGTTVVTTEYNDVKGGHGIAGDRKGLIGKQSIGSEDGELLKRWDAGESRPRQLRDRRL